jgi:NarL family two-component system response regulator LiaR
MSGDGQKIKVFIIDDNIAARSIIAGIVRGEDDIEIVGEAGTGQGGIIMLGDVMPDVIMLEATVSGGMLLNDIIKEIRNVTPDAKIIICADTSLTSSIPEITQYGTLDFVTKPFKKNMLLRSIRAAAEEYE